MFLRGLVVCTFFCTISSFNIKTGKFSVTRDTEVDQAQVLPAGSQTLRNLLRCVYWFHTREDACFGDYDNSSKICNIFTTGCCVLNTNVRNGVFTFKRDLQGFSQPSDCTFYKNRGDPDGVFQIYPQRVPGGFQVYCEMTTDTGGWTIIQKRYDGSVDFYRTWEEYKTGFGDVSGEYWLGNEYIHKMTVSGGYILRINMDDSVGPTYAEYHTFSVASEEEGYRLSIGQFCGTAYEDNLYGFSHNDGSVFSTKDRNTAYNNNGENCTWIHRSGWWFKPNQCATVNLNGQWNPDVVGNTYAYWFDDRTFGQGLRAITMMIRRK